MSRLRLWVRAWTARAILWVVQRYFVGRPCDLDTHKAVVEGSIRGSRVEYDHRGVPTDLTLFWAPDGGSDLSDIRRFSFTRVRRTHDGRWAIHE